MIAPVCGHENLKKHGKDRKGAPALEVCHLRLDRHPADHNRPLGDMRIEMAQAVQVLKMLLEGMSIRACEHIRGIHHGTICDLVLHVGENCNRMLLERVQGIRPNYVELDELWGFIGAKNKTAVAKRLGADMGDSWTWLAIDGETKLILSHAVGQRDEYTCNRFLDRLNKATEGQMQVTSDGLATYTHNVPFALGTRVDFAQLVKIYSSSQTEHRYSPATIIEAKKTPPLRQPRHGSRQHVLQRAAEPLRLECTFGGSPA